MKEDYLKSGWITEGIEDIRCNTPPQRIKFDPQASALIAVDVQMYFTRPESPAYVPSAVQAVGNILLLIDYYHSRNMPVIMTQHYDSSDASSMRRIFKGRLSQDDPLFLIDEALNERGVIVRKTTYDAFYGTELQTVLSERGIKQCVLCGFMAERCVETTARSAFVRGFDVFIAADASAAYTKDIHIASLKSLASSCANIKKTKEIINAV